MKPIFSSCCFPLQEEIVQKFATCLQKLPSPIVFLVGSGQKGEWAQAIAERLKTSSVYVLSYGEYREKTETIAQAATVVDGLDEEDEEFAIAVIPSVTSASVRVAIDLPYGLNEWGQAAEICFCATQTYMVSGLRFAHLLNDGIDVCGERIDLTDESREGSIAWLAEPSDVQILARKRNTHKGTYGKIAVLGGSARFPSAPIFTASAALRCGAGLVTLYAPRSYASLYASQSYRGYTLDFLSENGKLIFDCEQAKRIANTADVVVMGMGMGNLPATRSYVEYFLQHFAGRLVLDADALNVLEGKLSLLQGCKPSVILTPHVGEYRRLFQAERVVPAQVKEYAARYGVVLAVKSCSTLISDGTEVWLTDSGSAVLAKGGSGDSLAGMVAAFCVTDSPLLATVKACYVFGKAGEESERAASNPLSPSPLETIDCIPSVLASVCMQDGNGH